MKPQLGIYIHIPFCNSKCLYCDFTSYDIKNKDYFKRIETYVEALKTEIEMYKHIIDTHKVHSIYIGGGTPSAIDPNYISAILSLLPVANEVTIEINPGTLTQDKIDVYKASGINRVSLGLQSNDDRTLKSLGRKHDYQDFLEAYKLLRNSHFNNISIDLMFGLPEQKMEDVHSALHAITQINPEHVSVYSLKVEEGTPFYDMVESNLIKLPDEELERDMYHYICTFLEKMGLCQYEISNFSKVGYASEHNLVYWKNEPYLGLGVSAHGKINGFRYANASKIDVYIEKINLNQRPIESTETINDKEDLFETIMLGLRLNEGICIEHLNNKYNIDFETQYDQVLAQLLKDSLIVIKERIITLTALGRDVSNRVFVAFL